ncbi:hypothetical protein D3C86_2032180 [compost metagenome]
MEPIRVICVPLRRDRLSQNLNSRLGKELFHYRVAQIEIRLTLKPCLKRLRNFCERELTRLSPSTLLDDLEHIQIHDIRKVIEQF